MKPNKPVDRIPVPSGLSAYLLLIPLRGQEECRKQAGIGHWGRWEKNTILVGASIAYYDDNQTYQP